MVRAQSDFAVSLMPDRKSIHLRLGGQAYRLGPSKAFSVAHELLLRGRFDSAAAICEALSQLEGAGQWATIVLAYCKAGLRDYAACNSLLRRLFPENSDPVAEGLQAAFVYNLVGMRPDAIRELSKIIRDRPDLPTACLLLGDLFAARGQSDKAAYCWRLAIQRDPGGVVAAAAKGAFAVFARKLQTRSQNVDAGLPKRNAPPPR